MYLFANKKGRVASLRGKGREIMNDVKSLLSAKQTARDVSDFLSGKIADEEIAEIMSARKIGTCKVHVSKPCMAVSLGITDVIKDKLSVNENQTLIKSGNRIVVSAFNEQMAKLKSIEEGCRSSLRKLSIGDSSYIEEDNMKEFIQLFSEKKAEFDEVVAYILSSYDGEVQSFLEKVHSIAFKLNDSKSYEAVMKDAAFRTRLSAADFCKGFRLTLESDFDPQEISDEAFSQAVRDFKSEQAYQGMLGIITGTLNNVWEGGCNYLKTLYTITGSSTANKVKSKKMMKTLISNMSICKQFHLFTVLANMIERAIATNDLDQSVEETFYLLSACYGFASENGLSLNMKKLPSESFNGYDLLTEKSLELIYADVKAMYF